MLPFHEVVAEDFSHVNEHIVQQLHSEVGLVENIGHYIVEAGGKRLRPLLVLLGANALGHQGQSHIGLAAIIEFIHTATLLHDDVVDISSLRRGRATANAKWGNAPSVLVGDFLYSRAFQMLVSLGNMEIMRLLSDTTNLISEGEVQQLVNAKNPKVTEDNYFTVIYKKTAALFETASEAAAVLACATAKERQALKHYGRHLGIAFQLVDDALDYSGDTEALGKNVGDDLAEGKPTLPLIHAMQHAPADDVATIQKALTEGRTNELTRIVNIVRHTGSLEYTAECAQSHSAKAQQQLAVLPESPFRQAMAELADFAITRNH